MEECLGPREASVGAGRESVDFPGRKGNDMLIIRSFYRTSTTTSGRPRFRWTTLQRTPMPSTMVETPRDPRSLSFLTSVGATLESLCVLHNFAPRLTLKAL